MRDPSVRLYLSSARWVGRALRLARGTFDGFWLGALSDAQLDAIDDDYYRRKDIYRDPTYNAKGLLEWERRAVDGYFPEGARVAVLGAGGGREVLALLDLGFDAVGFECNAVLAAEGEAFLASRGHAGRLHACARDVYPVAAGPCDAVVVGWGAYMLIRGRPRRVAMLRDVHDHLPTGGPVLLSFFARSGVSLHTRAVTTVGSAMRRLRGQPPLEVGDALAPNFVHIFTEAQLRSELEDAGFELAHWDAAGYGNAVGVAR